MTVLNVRANTFLATTNTTWATTANAVDGAYGVNSATYSVWTNTLANAVGTIDVGFDTQLSSVIGAADTINSVTVTLRHLESNTTRLANVQFQPYDSTTAIGTLFTATRATSARSDTTTFPVTLAQLRSSTFKIRTTATRSGVTQAGTFSIDYVDISIDYTPAPPSITQAAYRFYADGTETGDVVSEYTVDNFSTLLGIDTGGWTAHGQSFLGDGKSLAQASFYLNNAATPNGTVTAALYAHTGTFGSTGVPTGSPLETSSTTYNASSLSLDRTRYDFAFSGSYTLVNGTPYFIVVSGTNTVAVKLFVASDNTAPTHAGNSATLLSGSWSAVSTRDVLFRVSGPDSTALAAQDATPTVDVSSGDVNLQLRTRLQSTSAVAVGATDDFQLQWEKNASGSWFEAYGPGPCSTYDSPSLTNGAATTGRLTGGTGAFTAGKVSEDGLVDDLGWAGNDHTELLYSLTLKKADLANGDTLRFRVLRNGATTDLTYTQTPTISIFKEAPVGGQPNAWSGSAWGLKPMKYWTGSAWVEKPLKEWNGSSWDLA